MTNAQIIMNESINLLENGIIKGTGRMLEAIIVDKDGNESKKMVEEPEAIHTYATGKDKYYMSYEESSVTPEVLEVLENSFLSDLFDALEVETDADLLHAIKEEIGKRTIKTNIGTMPVEDYLEIQAMQSGFDSYEDMKKHGYSIDIDKLCN